MGTGSEGVRVVGAAVRARAPRRNHRAERPVLWLTATRCAHRIAVLQYEEAMAKLTQRRDMKSWCVLRDEAAGRSARQTCARSLSGRVPSTLCTPVCRAQVRFPGRRRVGRDRHGGAAGPADVPRPRFLAGRRRGAHRFSRRRRDGRDWVRRVLRGEYPARPGGRRKGPVLTAAAVCWPTRAQVVCRPSTNGKTNPLQALYQVRPPRIRTGPVVRKPPAF